MMENKTKQWAADGLDVALEYLDSRTLMNEVLNKALIQYLIKKDPEFYDTFNSFVDTEYRIIADRNRR